MSQAPAKIKNIYKDYYIGNERDFLDLLIYLKEYGNFDKVLKAIEQLQKNPLVEMTTEKIIFLANQVEPAYKPVNSKDEVTSQSLENLRSLQRYLNLKRQECFIMDKQKND